MQSSRMRVAHVITSTDVGGAQIMLQRYLSALGDKAVNHSVISMLPDGSIAAPIRASGASVLSLDLPLGKISVPSVLRLRRILVEIDPAVVHGWMYHGSLAAWAGLAGRMSNRPALIWGVHHSLQDIQNEKRTTRLIVQTPTGRPVFNGRIDTPERLAEVPLVLRPRVEAMLQVLGPRPPAAGAAPFEISR